MTSPRYADERNKVLIGNLPDDFLRVPDPNPERTTNGTSQSPQLLYQQQQQMMQQQMAASETVNQIIVCVVRATLNKNYSLTKMDPYVRVRIGHSVFETQSDVRGGKSPNWNKTVQTYLPKGIKTIHLEVFDENTITPDERVAYADYVIPDEVLQGKFTDTWIPLSGKQGVDKEGSINITIYIRSMPYWSAAPPAPLMVVPQQRGGQFPYYVQGPHVTVQYQPQPQPMQNPNYAYPVTLPPQTYRPTEDEIKQVQEMFPDFDREVILGVLETCRGNKDQAINSLLTLSSEK